MLSIRSATMDDARLLLEWRNDPLTRANSRSPAPVAWADHRAWLERVLADPDRRLLVIEAGGVPAATIRFDGGPVNEASFTIAPQWRHRGHSLELMKFALEAAPVSHQFVKPENLACLRLIGATGATYLGEEEGLQHWCYASSAMRAAA